MAHTKPNSFHEFEGHFTLSRLESFCLLKFQTTPAKYRNHAGGKPTASCRASITPLQSLHKLFASCLPAVCKLKALSKWFTEFINVSLEKARLFGCTRGFSPC